MPKTDRNDESSISKGQTSADEMSSSPSEQEGRYVTDEERGELVEDAKQFKKEHDGFFRRLAGKDE